MAPLTQTFIFFFVKNDFERDIHICASLWSNNLIYEPYVSHGVHQTPRSIFYI